MLLRLPKTENLQPKTSDSVATVRKLLPANDDALPLYVQTQGAMVGKSGDRLTIKYKDEVLAERRLMDVSQVSLFGNVMISAQALRELTTQGIPLSSVLVVAGGRICLLSVIPMLERLGKCPVSCFHIHY